MWFFSPKQRQSVVLIDIGSSSVAGAYAHYEEKALPTMYYTVRYPIVKRAEESLQEAMLRTLDQVGADLIEKGSGALRRETGSGHVHGVLVSVAAPWQETNVRTESIKPGKPFTFTKKILSEAVAGSSHIPEDRISFGESVIATILNGYDIPNPIGKKVNRAEVVILSSTLEKAVTEEIRTRVRKLYHTHTVNFTAFAPVAYSVIRDLYPHEQDFLVLDVSAEGTDLCFVKNGLLVDVGTLSTGTSSLLTKTRSAERMTIEEEKGMAPAVEGTGTQPGYIHPDRNARFAIRASEARDEWLQNLAKLFKKFAQLHALPRTLFLLADADARDYLKHALDNQILHTLWLSDEPLSIINIKPEQFSAVIRSGGAAESDIFLSILALYEQKQLS